jgi:hypothetical protein
VIVFFNIATDSLEDEERRFAVDFCGGLLFIMQKQKPGLGTPVRVNYSYS